MARVKQSAVTKQAPSAADETELYLHRLYGPGLEACPESFLYPAVLPAPLNGDAAPVSRGFRSAAEAAEWCGDRARNNNLYHHIALHRAGVTNKGSADTAMVLPGLFCDLDAASAYRKSNKAHAPDVKSLRGLCGEFEKRYSVKLAVVNSGFGLYAELLFREPWVFDSEEERREAARLLRRYKLAYEQLAEPHGSAGSVESVDLAKILRVPGTLNHKPATPLPVTFEMPNGYCGVNPSELDEWLPQLPEETKTLGKAPPFTINPQAEPPAGLFKALQTNDSKFAFTWNRERPDLTDQTLSGFELSIANITAAAGWQPQQMIDTLVAFRRKYGKPPKHRASYAITLTKAIGNAESIQSRRESAAFDAALLVRAASPLEALNAAKTFQMGGRRLRITNVLQRGQKFYLIDDQNKRCDLGTVEQYVKPSHAQARILRDLHFPINPQNRYWLQAAALVRELGAQNYEDVEDSIEDETRGWLAQALRPIPVAHSNAMSRHEIYLANQSVGNCSRGTFVYGVYTPNDPPPVRFILWRPGGRLMVHPPSFLLWGTSQRGLDKRNLTLPEVNQRLDALGFKNGKPMTGREKGSGKENQQRWSISPPNFEVERGAKVQPGWSEAQPESPEDDLSD